MAELTGIKTFYKPKNKEDIKKNIHMFLENNDLKPQDIDLVITGKNGDLKNDAVYNNITLPWGSTANYKHLCGEYPTSVAFALWLAVNVIKQGNIPAIIAEGEIKVPSLKKVLIYNHYQNNYHSLMLLSAC